MTVKPRAVIVDDSALMRRSLRAILERNGIEVVGEGENGIEAVRLCEELHPDLLTLDIIMPKLDGLQTLRLIKGRHPEIRVLMATALSTMGKVRDCMAAGANHYLVKPFDEGKVVEVLATLGGPPPGAP